MVQSQMTRICPVCRSEDTSRTFTYNGEQLIRCKACEFVFTSVRHFSPDLYNEVYANQGGYRGMMDAADRAAADELGIKRTSVVQANGRSAGLREQRKAAGWSTSAVDREPFSSSPGREGGKSSASSPRQKPPPKRAAMGSTCTRVCRRYVATEPSPFDWQSASRFSSTCRTLSP